MTRYRRFEKISAMNNMSPKNPQERKDGTIVYTVHD
jgi:hypothetical protein